VLEVVHRACADERIDALRIIAIGERTSALVAFDLAARASGVFRGVLVLDGPIDTSLARETAPAAAAAGLRVTVVRTAAGERARELTDLYERWFAHAGFGTRGSFELVGDAPHDRLRDPMHRLLD
jgi:hypothetical protein